MRSSPRCPKQKLNFDRVPSSGIRQKRFSSFSSANLMRREPGNNPLPLAQRISVNDYNHAIQVSVDWLMRENTIDSLRSAYELFITQVIVSNNGDFAFDSNALFLNSVRRGAM